MFALLLVMMQAVTPTQFVEPFGVDSPGYIAIRFVHFAAMTLFVGVLAFRLAVVPRFARRTTDGATIAREMSTHLAAWIPRTLLALTVAQLLRLAAQHRVYFEDGAWTAETLRPLLLQSQWGQAWLLATITILLSLATTLGLSKVHSRGWFALVVCAFVLSWTMAMSGHPAVADNPLLAMALDAAHVIGAGGWVGSLFIMMFVAVPNLLGRPGENGHAAVAAMVSAFSPVALGFAAVLASTGALAAWRNVGTLPLFLESDYGRLVLIKVGLVMVTAGIGAINWKRVLPKLGEPVATRLLRRSAVLELTAATLVLLATAILVATAMPEM